MFARFDENPAMTLRVIKETKHYGWTHGRTHARTDNLKTVYPLQTKFAGGIINSLYGGLFFMLFLLSVDFFQNKCFQKIQEHNQNVKRFVSKSGLKFCQS